MRTESPTYKLQAGHLLEAMGLGSAEKGQKE